MNTLNPTLTLRPLDARDLETVERLAQLDTRAAPEGPLLGAEVEGRLLAAVSIETGHVVADPFSRTAELTALLELRAVQLRERRPRLVGRLRPRRARVSATAGGRVAALHPRAS